MIIKRYRCILNTICLLFYLNYSISNKAINHNILDKNYLILLLDNNQKNNECLDKKILKIIKSYNKFAFKVVLYNNTFYSKVLKVKFLPCLLYIDEVTNIYITKNSFYTQLDLINFFEHKDISNFEKLNFLIYMRYLYYKYISYTSSIYRKKIMQLFIIWLSAKILIIIIVKILNTK